MHVVGGLWIRWLVSKIRSCADELGCGWERNKVQRTAKRYDDDGHGEDVGLRLLLLAAVIMAVRALPPQMNRRRMAEEKRHGNDYTRSSTSCNDTEQLFVLST